MSDDAPKSAYELAMERLRKKDADAGVESKPPTDEQRQAIAEVRRVYEARLAEREILFQSELRKIQDPEAAQVLDEDYRRDRDRLNGERDRKIEEIRGR
jgi:rRNA maturation endonuclease Nob1